MWNPFGLIRLGYRSAKPFLRRAFVVTLPFTLFYFVFGGTAGYFLADYHIRMFMTATEHFYQNFRDARELDWFSVPGGPGIHDVGIRPYWVPQLRDPSNWWVKLGLSRFDVPPIFDENQAPPFDHLAFLNSLHRKTSEGEENACWHHWVYASDQSFHFEDLFFDAWDSAFNELLQYHYANPARCNAEFHFITCPGSFLCDIWQTRGPALIHFTTETANLWPHSTQEEREAIPGYTPVTARIIEFPITKPDKMALMPGVFPTPFEQMRSITSDPHIWQSYVPWSDAAQEDVRVKEMIEKRSKDYPNSFGRLLKFESWLSYNIIKDSRLDVPATVISSVGMTTFYITWRIIDLLENVLSLIVGTGGAKEGDLEADIEEETATMSDLEPNFLAQGLRDFFDSEGGNFYENEMEATPEGRKALNKLWEIARNGPDKRQESDPGNEDIEAKAM